MTKIEVYSGLFGGNLDRAALAFTTILSDEVFIPSNSTSVVKDNTHGLTEIHVQSVIENNKLRSAEERMLNLRGHLITRLVNLSYDVVPPYAVAALAGPIRVGQVATDCKSYFDELYGMPSQTVDTVAY
jgi:hypothetical protein